MATTEQSVSSFAEAMEAAREAWIHALVGLEVTARRVLAGHTPDHPITLQDAVDRVDAAWTAYCDLELPPRS